ncbi:MAG: hypothetical protein HY781_02130 [Chloroflexi bacterium]|nr:hypothetical protein [Chloroflexota bacterium]
MRTCRTLILLALTGLLLAACAPAASGTEIPTAVPGCGDGVCGAFEDPLSCPEDCEQASLSGKTLTTTITSEGIGEIAVLVAYPETPRFPEGAGVVVIVSPFFTEAGGFMTEPDFTSIGLIGVEYFVGQENPTVDTLSSLEIGHYDEDGLPVQNPFYAYPAGYSPSELTVNYGTLRWDAEYTDENSHFIGRPYLDLDGDGLPGEADQLFGWQVPQMFGKRYYSVKLTQALLDNGVLTSETWPADLATPQEAAEAWAFRQSPPRYMDLALKTPDMKVMLVFARSDHAQVAVDKPHIHQAFQGFRFAALLRWVRLNPDRVYLQQFTASSGLDFPDNPANTQPEDWLEIRDWAYPGGGLAGKLASLAALAEMADRAHPARWDENLGDVLYEYTPSTPQP